MQTSSFVIQNEVGLHARPAALFVQTAAKFKSKIMVKNKTRDTAFVDAKSILSVLGIAVGKLHEIEMTFAGEDETAALEALTDLVASNFGEG